MGIVNSRSNRTLHNLVQIIAIPLQCSSCNYVMYMKEIEMKREKYALFFFFLFSLLVTIKTYPGY